MRCKHSLELLLPVVTVLAGVVLGSCSSPTRTASSPTRAATGADLNTHRVIVTAIRSDDRATVQSYLDAGTNVNLTTASGMTYLAIAATRGRTEIVKALLAKGANINAQSKEGVTPLMGAAAMGHLDIVNLLLANGADVNAAETGASGEAAETTALMAATLGNYPDIVRALIAKGADVNARNKNGHSALLFSQAQGYTEIAGILKQAGATE